MAERPDLDEEKDESNLILTRFGVHDTRRSTVWFISISGHRLVKLVHPKSRKVLPITTTKAEYIALSGYCAQIPWKRSHNETMDLCFPAKISDLLDTIKVQLLDAIVPAFLKELIYKVLGLQVLFLELNRFGILLGEWEEGQITSSGWPFVSTVLGQMAHLVASISHDSTRSYVMQSAFLTQETVSSIPIVFSWSNSIRPEGFLSYVLLWLVIIVAVVGVSVTVVVVVESSSVVKLLFVTT
ncbi:hypothetical protein Tco_0706677 [Tanacetum coccineum]|uniref:Uncharacterized protein n=1 Tax=Tanacetum coccineum TaxID=301880 RepID=A0ABQ4Y915_9ASTR